MFIVVCNNTTVSKLVFDYIAGWEKPAAATAATVVGARQARRCSRNVEDGGWLDRPNTILVDSEQLESGEAMSAEFKRIAAARSTSSRPSTAQRFPGRDADELTDEDLLREVMNTVGKPGSSASTSAASSRCRC